MTEMAIVIAGMAEIPQVFLPYAQTDNGQNLYERIQSNPSSMKMLGSQS